MTDYPYADTEAARMLSNGLHVAASERELSLRQIGKRLGYSQPVVLSHWATGRTPIPIDRAVEVAREVGLPEQLFLEAVLQQRHPAVDWQMFKAAGDPFCVELEAIAGRRLSELPADQQRFLREAVRDPDPRARWLSIAEVPAVKLLRELFPRMTTNGLSEGERETLRIIAELLNEQDLGTDESK